MKFPWDHIDNYRDLQYKGTSLARFIEKNGNDKENTTAGGTLTLHKLTDTSS
jgi:hypothetical protein